MKENIYTIPVLDGFKDEHECPFCKMKDTLEKDTINFVLGPSYMENDVRLETNKYGFCNDHLAKLYNEKNRLGLALMLQTHLQKTREHLEKLIEQNPSSPSKGGLKKLFGGKLDDADSPVQKFLQEKVEGCYICNRVNATFDLYIDTFFYLLKKDDDMWNKLSASKGFCLEHFNLIYGRASSKLSGNNLEKFNEVVLPMQIENLKRVEEDLDWFAKKFDHRFKDAPWKNSRDAVTRSAIKTNGLHLE